MFGFGKKRRRCSSSENEGDGDQDSVSSEEEEEELDLVKGKKKKGASKRRKKAEAVIMFEDLVARFTNKNEAWIFAMSEELKDAPCTFIKVKQGPMLRFPIMEEDLDALIPLLKPSPFGLGEKTVLDTSVRNSWQLNPDDFMIGNPTWDKYIQGTLCSKIAKAFSLKENTFTANLYKMLLYKKGSFFKSHRDSEKQPGMFGTLVVQLPSKFTGGKIVIQHDGEKKTFDHSSQEFSSHMSAFYCDCEHEIRPITSGVRVCLIYNLVMAQQDKVPGAPTAAGDKTLFKELIEKLQSAGIKSTKGKGKMYDSSSSSGEVEGCDDPGEWIHDKQPKSKDMVCEPRKLVYLLAHSYSESSLYSHLKGEDKAVADALKAMSQDLNMVAFLAIMEKKMNGTAAEDDGYYRDGDHIFGGWLVHYSVKKLQILAAPNDIIALLSGQVVPSLSCKGREVFPYKRLRQLREYNLEVSATGNEGTEVFKQYKRAAIVIMPLDRFLRFCSTKWDRNLADQIFIGISKRLQGQELNHCARALVAKPEGGSRSFRSKVTTKCHQLMELIFQMVELQDRSILSSFMDSYQEAIMKDIGTVLFTIISKRTEPGWNFAFDALMKLIRNPKLSLKCGSSITAAEVIRAFSTILDLNDSSILSDFFQGYSQAILYNIDNILPTIVAAKDTLGAAFIRGQLMNLLEKYTRFGEESELKIKFPPTLDSIMSLIDDENDKSLVKAFLKGYRPTILRNVDTFLTAFLERKDKLGMKLITEELEMLFEDSDPSSSLSLPNERTRKYITSCEPERLISVLNIIQTFEKEQIVAKFLATYEPVVIANSNKILPTIISLHSSFGWTLVSNMLKNMMSNASSYIQCLQIIKTAIKDCYYNGVQEQAMTYRECLQLTLNKYTTEADSNIGIGNRMASSLVPWDLIRSKKTNKLNESDHLSFLVEIWSLAEAVDFDLLPFLLGRPASIVIKVLENMAPKNNGQLTSMWKNVAQHLFQNLKPAAEKKVVEPQWRIRNDFTVCQPPQPTCSHCPKILEFMKNGAKATETFNIPKIVWDKTGHVRNKVQQMKDIGIVRTKVGRTYVSKLTKERPSSCQEEIKSRNQAKSDLRRLKALADRFGLEMN